MTRFARKLRGNRRRQLLRALVLLAIGLLVLAGLSAARKVGNPGSFHAVVTDGLIRIKQQTFNFDDSDPNNTVTLDGTITAQGSVNVPESGIHFPDQEVSGYTVRIIPSDPATGTLNPLTGTTSLRLRVWIKIDGIPFGGGCRIGSDSSPIDLNTLITGTTNPPGPNSPISGTPYNPSNGTVRVVNNSYSVPASSDCGPAAGTVNDQLGIPSSAGNNEARFTLDFTPTITKGVNASFTTTPSSGEIPYTVNVDASASTRTCSPNACSFRWDWDNNGTTDNTTTTPTTSHQYTTAGNHTIKLTVVDTDGDTDSTTRTVSALPHPPDLAIDKSHTGNFLAGANGTYTLAVSNGGTGATQGTTTVTDTLPSGLSFVSATGSGWSCGAAGQVVTCTRSALISAGASAPNITLTTAVANNAPSSLTNTASVSSTSNPVDPNSANNSDSDQTTIDRIDLGITKSHNDPFKTGTVETYNLDVENHGNVATNGTTTINDTLPGGISYQGFTAPAGWSCGAAGQAVTCTTANAIAAGQTDTVSIQVVAGAIAVPSVTNTATVSTPTDSNAANNSSSDPTTVIATVDLTVDKNHSSAFRVGSSASYTIAVQNRGARPSAGTTSVHDTLPDGVIPTGADGNGWQCAINGQDVDCTNDATLGANDTAGLITIDVSVTSAAARPSVTNTATVSSTGTGDDADANTANNSDDDPTTITATDLTIDKSHVGGFPLGGQGTYTLTVRNDGSAPTVGTTTVTDTLPAELSFVNASGSGWNCDAVGQVVTCTRSGSIGAGQTAPAITLQVDVADVDEEETVNSASVSTADDINPANDSDTDITPLTAADLRITKSHSSDFRVGTGRAYVIRVANIGSKATSGTTTVTDSLPSGLDYVDATGSGWSCGASGQDVTCTRDAAVAAGANAPAITVQVDVEPGAYPAVTNVAEVSNAQDRNDANDSASDPTTVLGSDLAVDKSHLGSLQVNDPATYLIAVSNQGTADTVGPATVTDTLPDGVSFTGSPSDAWDCSSSGQDVSCEHPGSIPAGQSAQTLELKVDIDSSVDSQITNTAQVALTGDVDSSNDADSDAANVGRIDLSIDKSHSGDLSRGDSGSYAIDVENEGSDPTSGTTRVTDTLPTGLTYKGGSGTGWNCSVSSGTVTCLHPNPIAAGTSAASITLQVDVAPGAPAQLTNTASVDTPGDANGANDSDSDPANVVARLDAAVSIRPNGEFRVGSQGSYEVSVRNVGSDSLSGPLTATVSLPAGLTYLGADSSDFICSAVGQDVTCTDADGMPADSRADIALEVGVTRQAAPGVTTTAQVAAPGDSVAANDSASAPTTVTMIDAAVSMQHSGTFAVNAQSFFTINVENVGTANTVSPVRIVDELPAGLTFNGGSGGGWTCGSSGQIVSCTQSVSLPAGAQASPLTLTVTPAASVGGQTLTNRVNVLTTDDADNTNNFTTDSVTIGPAPTPATPTTPSSQARGQVAGRAKSCKKKPKKRSASAAKKKKKKKCKRKKK